MDVTCQVAHLTTGRIRLQVANLATQPQIGRFLVDFFLRIQGVTGVQVRPVTGSAIITFDPTRCNEQVILDTLRSRMVRQPAPESEALPAASAPEPAVQRPYLAAEIAHAVAGRTRLRIPGIWAQRELAGVLEHFLANQAGIRQVRLNPAAESLVISHDPGVWTAASLLTLARAYNPDPLDIEQWVAAQKAAPDEEHSEIAKSQRDVALAGSALALALLGGPMMAPVAYGLLAVSSWSIFRKAHHTLVHQRRLTVDTLDATAIALLAATGVVWQAAFVTVLLSGADWIRDSTQERARKALSDVLDYMSDLAWVERDGQIISIPAQEVTVGELVLVFPGERVPVDGVVQTGKALLDQHALTGESMPVEKSAGDEVFAATVVTEGEMRVQATRVGQDTQVAQIVQLVQNAPVFDTRAQDYAEKWANRLVPFSFAGAALLALMGNFNQAITLLVLDYAAGFRVSAPTAIMSTITKAARQGILIRGGRHVEQLAEIDALVFDKTGTLTHNTLQVTDILPLAKGVDEEQAVAMVASLGEHTAHPIARAVVELAQARHLAHVAHEEVNFIVGHGVEGRIGDNVIRFGSRHFLEDDEHVSFAAERAQVEALKAEGKSMLYAAQDDHPLAMFALRDRLRDEAAPVLARLRAMGIKRMVMITGDAREKALAFGNALGMDEVHYEQQPEDKAGLIAGLKAAGAKVAYVGDGVNDGPALMAADVGIAMPRAADIARATADILLVEDRLDALADVLGIARDTMDLIRSNFRVAVGVNSAILAGAASGRFAPATTALLHNGTTIAVLIRSMQHGRHGPLRPPAG